MRETKREKTYRFYQALERLGIDVETADKLRRIEKAFSRWDELECGTGEGQIQRSIERDENGKPFYRVQYPRQDGSWSDTVTPIADREAQAEKRLAKIMANFPDLVAYHQSDCRGPSLYLVKKADLEGLKLEESYTRGVAVCID